MVGPATDQVQVGEEGSRTASDNSGVSVGEVIGGEGADIVTRDALELSGKGLRGLVGTSGEQLETDVLDKRLRGSGLGKSLTEDLGLGALHLGGGDLVGNAKELSADKVDDILVLLTVGVSEGTNETSGAVRVRERLDQAGGLGTLLDGGRREGVGGHEGVADGPVPVTDELGDNPLLQSIGVGGTDTLQSGDGAQGAVGLITEGKARTSVLSFGKTSKVKGRRFGDGTEGAHGGSGNLLVVHVTSGGDNEALASGVGVHVVFASLGGDGVDTLGVTGKGGGKGGGLESNGVQVVHEETLGLQSQRVVLSDESSTVGIQVLTLSHGLDGPGKNLDRFVGVSTMGNNTHLLTVSKGSQNDTLLRRALSSSNFAQQVAGSSKLSSVEGSSRVDEDTNRAGLTSSLAGGNSNPIGKRGGG